jgi:hypothetical protein
VPGEAPGAGAGGGVQKLVSDLTLPTATIHRLRLRGGDLDGTTWSMDVGVGRRIACGTGPWSPGSVYFVTEETTRGPDGQKESIAVPAAF